MKKNEKQKKPVYLGATEITKTIQSKNTNQSDGHVFQPLCIMFTLGHSDSKFEWVTVENMLLVAYTDWIRSCIEKKVS